MKGASKVIMGATLAMVVTLAIVLGLILVLLAELYCSLLLRKRQLRLTEAATTTTTAAAAAEASSSTPRQQQNASASPPPRPPPLSSYYSQGVIQAPRSLLFPLASGKENNVEGNEKLKKLHHILDIQAQELGLGATTRSHSSSIADSPDLTREIPPQISPNNACPNEDLVYISNPMYDACRPSQTDTPFETPDSSPSRLEMGGSSSNSSSSGDSEEESAKCGPPSKESPPLTPMKKLPAEACSVSLRDATSLGTSGSDSVSNNGVSSSSGSPCTSPSW